MEQAKWNLNLQGMQSIRITQISFISNHIQNTSHDKIIDDDSKKRLLLLSHQICYFGTPCIFFDKSPDYSLYFADSKEQPVIIVYDFFLKFDDFQLPKWAQRSDFIISINVHHLHKDFLNHFQLSLVLYYFYYYRKQNPFYFTSFLLFSYTEKFSDPFVFRPIPVLRKNEIHIRIITSELNGAIVDPPIPLEIHSYIFVEPYSHPFFVEKIEEQLSNRFDNDDSDNDGPENFLFFSNNDINFNHSKNINYIATLKNADRNIITRKINKDFHYVLLTKTSLYLSKLRPAPTEEIQNDKGKLEFIQGSQMTNNLNVQDWNSINKSSYSDQQNHEMNFTSNQNQNQAHVQQSSFFNFNTTEFYTFNDQSFGDFFQNHYQKNSNLIDNDENCNLNEYDYEYEEDTINQNDSGNKSKVKRKKKKDIIGNSRIDFFDSKESYFEYPDVTFFSIILEEISDKKARKALLKTFKRIKEFSTNDVDLILPTSSFISFFQFELPLCKSEPPKSGQCFALFSDLQNIEYLNHPTVLVNGNGIVRDANLTTIFEDWKNCHYFPICGKKMANFVVFIVDFKEKNRVNDFFDALQASFTLHELGVLKPYPKGDAFIETTLDNFHEKTNNFFETNKNSIKPQTLSEFQQYPIISFVVCPNYFEMNLTSHSICSYISIDQIIKMKQSEIDHIAFTTYSRIRLFHPFPFGMIDIAPPVPASLFFGYRYLHPYLLARKPLHSGLTLHIAWDPISKIASWVDDIGSVSHNFPNQSLQSICSLILKITEFLSEITVEITFSILLESPPEDLVNQAISLFSRCRQPFSIFSIIPTPQIQIIVNTKIDDDIIIFDDVELTEPPTYIAAVPKCSCYVSSPNQPTYRISYYFNSKSEDDKRCLHEFSKNMSHLSWLSGDPRTNRRLFSYPPHIASLLRKVRAKTKIVTGFEFLP